MQPTDDLFNYAAGLAGKESGMNLAASHAVNKLLIAREIARKIAMDGNGTCTMDQVGVVLNERGISVGPWCGSVFKVKDDWRWTGGRVFSERISNHAREIRVWFYLKFKR